MRRVEPDDSPWKGTSKWSAQILARRMGCALTYALAQGAAGLLAPHLERSWNLFHRSEIAYERAQRRLLKEGLAAEITRRGEIVLELTPQGRESLPAYVRPAREWNRRWNGTWYLLAYDVPETRRLHRDVIRTALRQKRFGQFQRSTWIGPWDIRPWFEDLRLAGGITDYAMLFQARSVMGISDDRLVMQAWPWDDIDRSQSAYLAEVRRILETWKGGRPTPSAVCEAIRFETMSYLSAMADDPLLPRKLWPPHYLGEEVYGLHQAFLKAASERTRPS